MEKHYWIEARDHKQLSLIAHIPEGEEERFPTVVYGHGFTGNKIGDNRMGIELARFLCEQGFVVIRFDYIGSGESEGDFATGTSFSGWINDYQTVLAWVERENFVDSSKIGIIGHSFSGAIVTHLATMMPNIQSVCALAPVYHLEKRFKETILGEELWNLALDGQVISDFYNKKYSLSPSFVNDLLSYNMTESAKKVEIPMIIIHGENDQVLPYEDSIELFENLPVTKKELKLLKEEEHLFTHQIHPVVLSWFKQTL